MSNNLQSILLEHGQLVVPPEPTIPYVEGDGIGADIWAGARPVLDSAVAQAYGGARRLNWLEVLAGEKATQHTGSSLPEATLQAFSEFRVGIKGPLATPVGGGARSLNVALRKALDLYVCLRPVRWFKGVPSPVCHPEQVDMVIFRENTEDLYTGLEYELGSPELEHFLQVFKEHFPQDYKKLRFPLTSAIGLKPVSEQGSQRLVRAAIQYALDHQRRSVTLVHKGNVMKFTEGGFRKWGYALAEAEFGPQVYSMLQWEKTKTAQGESAANQELEQAKAQGRLIIKDVITDAMFEAALTRPSEYDVLASTNLNGDYLSDALAAQVGGLGIAPGANLNFETRHAIFEATHGTAPRFAGKNLANPSSLIFSGERLLRYLGWSDAADRVVRGVEGAIAARSLTTDLFALVEGATLVSTTEFAQAVIQHME